MSIYGKYLRLIADGRKTVEVRVGYRSMRRIAAGDLIRFVSGEEQCLTRVTRVTEYPSFEAMLDHEDARSIGADELETREELLAAIRETYPPEKEALGVLAIGVEVVDEGVDARAHRERRNRSDTDQTPIRSRSEAAHGHDQGIVFNRRLMIESCHTSHRPAAPSPTIDNSNAASAASSGRPSAGNRHRSHVPHLHPDYPVTHPDSVPSPPA